MLFMYVYEPYMIYIELFVILLSAVTLSTLMSRNYEKRLPAGMAYLGFMIVSYIVLAMISYVFLNLLNRNMFEFVFAYILSIAINYLILKKPFAILRKRLKEVNRYVGKYSRPAVMTAFTINTVVFSAELAIIVIAIITPNAVNL